MTQVRSMHASKASHCFSVVKNVASSPLNASKYGLMSFGQRSYLYRSNGSHFREAGKKGIYAESGDVKQAVPEDQKVASDDLVYKHILVPILDKNPYLSSATRQALETTTKLAKRYQSDITVVVIDESEKEQIADHDTRIKTIRWHLSEGGFEQFGLLEKLGEGKMPAAVIGEVADDLNLDLVVLSMEAVHSKHLDANLLSEFVPCPVLMLPL